MNLLSCKHSDILELHREIFEEEFNEQEFLRKNEHFPIHFFKLLEKEEIGYIALQYRHKTCHIWLTGIIPKLRGKGFGQKIFNIIEEWTTQKGFFTITLSTHNDRRAMLALAIKNGYRIMKTDVGNHGDRIKIRLSKQTSHKNELRILLTEKCNFKCFFCHSEGLNDEANYEKKSKEEIADKILEAMTLGYNDITFTGGEPLLRLDDTIYLLDFCNRLQNPPDITIVTNADLINDKLITAVKKYNGKFKFNISMHSMEPKLYSDIIVNHGIEKFDKIIKNIKKVTENNITVKLNMVILKGYNTGRKSLIKYLDMAHMLNVTTVKFLELMVVKSNKEHYQYFYSAEALGSELREISAIERSKSLRGTVFSHPAYDNLLIEVMKLTCKLGCQNCMDVRDRTLGPDLNYYPCFTQSETPLILDKEMNMEQAFLEGNKIIAIYAKKYGSDSPILIEEDTYLSARSDLYYKTNLSYNDCSEIFSKHGFSHTKTLLFSLHYYMPKKPSQAWLKFQKILKFGNDSKSNKYEFIYSTHSYSLQKEDLFIEQQSFLLPSPPVVYDIDVAKKIMDALDFKEFFTFDYELHRYNKGDLNVSIDKNSKVINFKISVKDLQNHTVIKLIKLLDASIIKEPFVGWFIRNNNGKV